MMGLDGALAQRGEGWTRKRGADVEVARNGRDMETDKEEDREGEEERGKKLKEVRRGVKDRGRDEEERCKCRSSKKGRETKTDREENGKGKRKLKEGKERSERQTEGRGRKV